MEKTTVMFVPQNHRQPIRTFAKTDRKAYSSHGSYEKCYTAIAGIETYYAAKIETAIDRLEATLRDQNL